MAGEGRIHRLLLVATRDPVVVSAGVNRNGVAHHSRGHSVGEADVNRAHSPGVPQVIWGEWQLITAELLSDPSPDLLQRCMTQVGADLGQ